MKAKSKNVRRHIRVKPESGQPITVDINGQNFVDVLPVRDISEGGLSIDVPHGFEGCHINEPVDLVVNLPSPVVSSFSATGKIKHVSAHSFGVVFLAMNPQHVKTTRRYVRHRVRHLPWWQRMGLRFANQV